MMKPIPLSLLLLALGVLAGCKKQPPTKIADSGPVKIRVARVETKNMQRVVEAVGTLYPYDEVIVAAEIDGPVAEVKVDLGDRVEQGQVLARISEEEQKYLLAENEARLRQALERLGLSHENDRVKDIRDTPEVRRAKADLDDAEQRYRRVRNLVDQGIGSQQELDEATARRNALQAAYDLTLNQTRNLIQEVERVKAVVDLQRKKLRDTRILAPFTGYVNARQITVGAFVRTNTPMFTLVKTDPIRLRVDAPEHMAPWIKEGQIAQVSVEAFADKTFTGKVWRISPTVDPSKRTFVVEALIPNPQGELKPGSFARARIPSSKFDTINLIPFAAVNYVLGTNKAYVVKQGAVEARDVKLGERFDELVEIVEGLNPGEVVATTELVRLDTGVKVEVLDARPS